MAASELDEVIEDYHRANNEFVRGNLEPLRRVFSHRDDVTLLNPRGALARGWEKVSWIQERAMAIYSGGEYSDGESTGFDRITTSVTPQLAFMAEVERYRARDNGSGEVISFALRVTTVFRPEDGIWKVVHRHADSITTVQLTEPADLQETSPERAR
jgi:ketosteroid isomerase-like protein